MTIFLSIKLQLRANIQTSALIVHTCQGDICNHFLRELLLCLERLMAACDLVLVGFDGEVFGVPTRLLLLELLLLLLSLLISLLFFVVLLSLSLSFAFSSFSASSSSSSSSVSSVTTGIEAFAIVL